MTRVCVIKCAYGHEHEVSEEHDPHLFRVHGDKLSNGNTIIVTINSCPTCRASYFMPTFSRYFADLKRTYSTLYSRYCVLVEKSCPVEAILEFAKLGGSIFTPNGLAEVNYYVVDLGHGPKLYTEGALRLCVIENYLSV